MISKEESKRREDEARAYLSKVIDQMKMSDYDLSKIIEHYTARLVDVSLKYSHLGASFSFDANKDIQREIGGVISDLKTDLYAIIYQRSLIASNIAFEQNNEEKDDNHLKWYLSSEIDGLTLQDRISNYANQLKYEIEMFIAIGVSYGFVKEKIINSYKPYIKDPYKAPIVLDAISKGGYSAVRIKSKGFTVERGQYKNAFNNLKRLEKGTIFQSYNVVQNITWGRCHSIVGWYTVRGSTFACGECDSWIGVLHQKSDYFYGYHDNCCCLMIPVYKEDL